MTNTKVSALSADASVGGSEKILAIDGSTEKTMTPTILRNYVNQLRVPAYVSGNWYSAWPGFSSGTSGALAVNTTYATPFVLWQDVTLSQLGGRTVAAGTNIQFGIYANNNSTMRPTGSCLAKTASISATSNTNVAAAISGGNVAFTAGIYWYCVAVDNAATTVLGTTQVVPYIGMVVGSSTATDVINSSQPAIGLSASDTFGNWTAGGSLTWAILSGAAFNSVAIPNFKVA